MSSHLLIRRIDSLNTSKPSYVMWSAKPATTVIFFMHGFLGSALSTWRQFDSLVLQDSRYEEADLVFLGYKSVKHRTNISAAEILKSCQGLINNPAAHMNNTIYYDRLKRPSMHQYKQVVFVAHSLGAIVARQLLLVAEHKKYSWLSNVRLVLFAPAHMGATNISNLPASIVGVLGPAAPLFGTLISWKAQTLSEMEVGSVTLGNLKMQTDHALKERKRRSLSLGHLIAEDVIFGTEEDVVSTTEFCEDPLLEDAIKGKGHQSICKPQPSYLEPISRLHKSIKGQ